MTQAADSSPLEELRSHRDEILALARRRGASSIRVFGSVARGQSTAESDVDFLVLFDAGRSLLDASGLLLDLQDLLGRKVDIVDEAALEPRDAEILGEAVPL